MTVPSSAASNDSMMASNSEGWLNELGRPSETTTNGSSLDERIGPFYDTKAVAALLGVSRASVYRRIKRQEILGVKTSDRRYLFPVWQFDEDWDVPEQLAEVLSAIDPHLQDPWGDALWLNSPASFLGGDCPIDRIRRGDMQDVLIVASRIGAMS